MGQAGLIERYLDELREGIVHVRDHLDTLAEVEDHLREAVVRLRQRGIEEEEAERRAVEDFGAPTLVARAIRNEGRGIAMPTQFTRLSGLAAMLSAAAAGLSALFFIVIESSQVRAWTFVPFATVASILLVVALLGIRARHGRRLGRLGRVAMILMAVSLPASLAFSWAAAAALAGMLGVVFVVFAVALLRARILPTGAVVSFAFGLLAAASVGLIGALVEADTGSVAQGFGVVSVFGLAWMGWWLWSERVVSVPPTVGSQLA